MAHRDPDGLATDPRGQFSATARSRSFCHGTSQYGRWMDMARPVIADLTIEGASGLVKPVHVSVASAGEQESGLVGSGGKQDTCLGAKASESSQRVFLRLL